jgi:hypothetical protein
MLCLLRGRVTTESAEITEVEESVRESRGDSFVGPKRSTVQDAGILRAWGAAVLRPYKTAHVWVSVWCLVD